MLRRKSLLKQNEVEDSMRRIYLAKMKQDDRLNHLKEVSPLHSHILILTVLMLLLLKFRLSVGGRHTKSTPKGPRRKWRREKLKRRKREKRG